MSIRYWSQLGVGLVVLVFSSMVSWYEGSALLEDPWEWRYSAPISEWMHGSVGGSNDISDLDFFIYAAKFSPLFPAFMIISASYLIVLIGIRIFSRTGIRILLVLFGLIELGLSFTLSTSPTAGGNLLTWLFLSVGLLMIILSGIIHLLPLHRDKHFSHQ
ncbi:YjdJ family protein [Bacillus sp. MCCB 382]|uniref:YjdJ family protein n=1 Tax=Bacillus sp. MCCB 382 TaxID=2860197 RepID=UPI001C597AD5|nr:YjdJ family protein [Bacillus sp. MCCB 382]